MVDALDLLRCQVCGTFYKPEMTPTGRIIPHCHLPVEIDWLTEDVVALPLTGTFLDMEV